MNVLLLHQFKKLFNNAIKDPLKASAASAANETVYTFITLMKMKKLHRINPKKGKQYSLADSLKVKNESI